VTYMQSTNTSEGVLPYILLGLTAVTGLVDAVSFLAIGRVFTANMTGNIVLLAFAVADTPGLSIARSLTALGAFMFGALLAGRALAKVAGYVVMRRAAVLLSIEVMLLFTAALTCSLRDIHASVGEVYVLIVLTAIAMGVRNATVRKLAVADMTTTVLTLTLTGLAADSSLAGGTNSRWGRRFASVVAMFAGAALGAGIVRTSVATALFVAGGLSLVCVAALWASITSSQSKMVPEER
jgi:uncharacterized membrane protein YoaK (UPF0700 family)